jgi:HSP20 family protein
MDRMFDRMTSGFWSAPFASPSVYESPAWSVPSTDLTEDDTTFTLTAEMPGLAQKDIELLVSNDRLVLSAEKTQEREETNKNVHLSERKYGKFRRSFQLPESVDRDKIEAKYADGDLTVTMAKQPADATRHI